MMYSGTGGFSGLTGIPAEDAGGTVSFGGVSLGDVSPGGVSLTSGVRVQEKKTAASIRQNPAGKNNFFIKQFLVMGYENFQKRKFLGILL